MVATGAHTLIYLDQFYKGGHDLDSAAEVSVEGIFQVSMNDVNSRDTAMHVKQRVLYVQSMFHKRRTHM